MQCIECNELRTQQGKQRFDRDRAPKCCAHRVCAHTMKARMQKLKVMIVFAVYRVSAIEPYCFDDAKRFSAIENLYLGTKIETFERKRSKTKLMSQFARRPLLCSYKRGPLTIAAKPFKAETLVHEFFGENLANFMKSARLL